MQEEHVEYRVNVFWYCFTVIIQYTFPYFIKSIPIPGNQRSFETLQLFDKWHYQGLAMLVFSSVLWL